MPESLIHQRRSVRLPEYDYSQPGAYFVTVVTHARLCSLGQIRDGQMCLSIEGKNAQTEWMNLPKHYPNVRLDKFVVMPNHIHGIIWLVETNDHGAQPGDVGAGLDYADPINLQAQKPALANREDALPGGDRAGFLVGTPDILHVHKPAPTGDHNVLPDKPNAKNHALSEIIRGFKTYSARKMNLIHHTTGVPFWQRGFHEHILRGDFELEQIRA